MNRICIILVFFFTFILAVSVKANQRTDSTAAPDSVNYNEEKYPNKLLVGASLFSPGDYNLILGGQLKKFLIRLEVGMSNKFKDPSYQFNLGVLLGKRKQFITHLSVAFGSSRVKDPSPITWIPSSGSQYGDGSSRWNFIGMCWDANIYGIFFEIGYGFGNGNNGNFGKVFFQLGYVFIL